MYFWNKGRCVTTLKVARKDGCRAKIYGGYRLPKHNSRMNPKIKFWPTCIAEAIRILDLLLSKEEKDTIRIVPLSELNMLHASVGRFICNEFGLVSGNDKLITATLEIDPDLASMTIIREYWDHLRAEQSLLLH